MLTIWTGADRAGLTDLVLQSMTEGAKDPSFGRVLVVPEQYSHEAERRLCLVGGDTVSRYAEVLSLSRLADRLSSTVGGAARSYLDKGGQILNMALAAEQIASRIKLYAPVIRKPEFLADMVRVIDEFNSYCLTPEQLLEAARGEEGLFAQKLEELGLLYEAYGAVCANGSYDPSDKMKRLKDLLAESDWACSKTFYIDGFSDFTGEELEVIRALMLNSHGVIIAVAQSDGAGFLANGARETVRQLKQLAASLAMPCITEHKHSAHTRHPDIAHWLDQLFSVKPSAPITTDRVRLGHFSSVEEECRAAAAQVMGWAGEGARYREICVACTDPSVYEAPLRSAFLTAGVPFYVAGETKLLSKPVIGAVLNSLYAVIGPMDYADAALYLKSSLPLLEKDRCDRLDNYAYLWNIKGSQWEKDFDRHPRGFGESWTDEDRQQLLKLNDDRKQAMEPLLHLRAGLGKAKNTGQMVLAVHAFLEELHLRERLEQQANAKLQEGNGQLAQELAQICDMLTNAMEQIWLTLKNTVRTPEDFCRLFELLLLQYNVATIPAGLDQVHLSNLPDLRYKTAKYLIVLGGSDGSLPSYRASEGLLSEEERSRLKDLGVSIAPGRAEQIELELARIHSALSAAEEYVLFTYAGDQPSWLFQRTEKLFPQALTGTEGEVFLRREEYAAWRCRNKVEGNDAGPEILSAEKALGEKASYRLDALARNTVRSLYGGPILLSPSKIDTFASCRLMYFLNYGLKAKPRKQARLDQPAFGTFVHAVLEHTVLRVMDLGGFEAVEKEEVLAIAAEEIHRYEEEYIPEQAQREAYLFERSKVEVLQIAEDLWQELRVSKFRPAFCEMKFAKDGMLPMIEVHGKHADSCIMGLVDRVDLYEEDGKTYVRIVDYKTGSKKFDYTDILNGSGLQMLIYLFALRRFGGEALGCGDMEPAGVLYLPAKKEYLLTEPMPEDDLIRKEHQSLRKRKGLIRSDSNLLAAMEEDPETPRFMPYKVGKNGISGDVADAYRMQLLEDHVIRTVETMTDEMAGGEVTPNPVIRGIYSPCRYCEYHLICHKDMGSQQPRIHAETSAGEFWNKLEMEAERNG